MLKRRSIRKVLLSFVVLSLLMLVYIIPTNKNELEIKEEIYYVNSELKTNSIYLLDNKNYLSKTSVVINSSDDISIIRELINILIIGGSGEDRIPSGFKSIINSNTKINTLSLDNGVLKIDFNEYVLDTNKELEEKIIEAIVYTVTSLENVKNVNIYINGNPLTYLEQSKRHIPSSLDRNFGINKEYDLKSTKDITKTTVYYVSKYNDDYYYTPITKVSNDSRDKINIIIDELSSTIISDNLMSFLSNKVTLLDSEIVDSTMYVNFNDAIIDNFIDNTILEEVLYTITLSINDNYDISEVFFQVNGQEITKTTIKTLE